MNTVLVLGNGINRLASARSWENLVSGLISKYAPRDVHMRQKPFTFLYEEILSTSILRQKVESEAEVLAFLAEDLKNFPHLQQHDLAMAKYSEILTTNYDYALEANSDRKAEKFLCKSRESRYSLYRKIEVGENTVWHIHGEANRPKTLCLGYEHYSGYIQNIRNYLTTGFFKLNKESLRSSLLRTDVTINSWVDHFFFSNVDIVGLTLDFVESDLWWLLIYRSRLINSQKLDRTNRVKYFMKSSAEYDDSTLARLEMLKANSVEVELVDANDYEEYFRKVLS